MVIFIGTSGNDAHVYILFQNFFYHIYHISQIFYERSEIPYYFMPWSPHTYTVMFVLTSLNSEMVPRNRWVNDNISFMCLQLTETHVGPPIFESESSGVRIENVAHRATALTLTSMLEITWSKTTNYGRSGTIRQVRQVTIDLHIFKQNVKQLKFNYVNIVTLYFFYDFHDCCY